MNKTFKGLMKNDTQERIRLSTNDGLTGYKIIKFKVFPYDDSDIEATMKVYSVKQANITNVTDFNDPTLLGAAYFTLAGSSQIYPEDFTVVIDNKIVNQDIYITLRGHNVTADLNYYLELEQVKLDLNEATVATLKDMRGRE